MVLFRGIVIYSEVRDPRFPNDQGSSLSELYDRSLLKSFRFIFVATFVLSFYSDFREERFPKLVGSESNSHLCRLRDVRELR